MRFERLIVAPRSGLAVAAFVAYSTIASADGEAVSPARLAIAKQASEHVVAAHAGKASPCCYGGVLPKGLHLVGVTMPDGDTARVTVRFPGKSLRPGDVDVRTLYSTGMMFSNVLGDQGISNVYLFAEDPATGRLYGFDELEPREVLPVPVQDEGYDPGDPSLGKQDPVLEKYRPYSQPSNISGSLSGKTIYLNQGHGWFDDVDFGRFRVQRGIVLSSGLLEDFTNAETINTFTIPFLQNAGAIVLTVRERDTQTNMRIIDNADGTGNPSNGTYVETGTWTNSTLRGFGQKATPTWVGPTVNPFNAASSNRLANVSTTGVTATAKWTPNIPAAGYYWVYASWSRFSGRSPQAQYLVNHAGGTATITVDQTKYGFMWYPLGQFYFEPGLNTTTGSVELTNFAATGATVSADAVRFGGGMGDMQRQTHGISGRPRWEEEAVLYLQWNGFGSSGLAYTGVDDEAGGWADRTQFAGYNNSFDHDSIYMGHHTNAAGGTAIGAIGYVTASTTTPPLAATISLRDKVTDEIIADVRAGWDAAWGNSNPKRAGNYGENSQSNLGTVPGFLMEALFHDSANDIAKYQQPKFRKIMGRSYMKGMIRYFSTRDSVTYTMPPEPPKNVWAKNLGGGQVQLGWLAPDFSATGLLNGNAASGYRIYRSTHGYGFDNGTAIGASTTTTVSGLTPGQLYFFRVVATNAGGYSPPTETIAVRLPSSGATQALLVNGFDREDAGLVPTQAVTNAGTVRWTDHLRFNTFDYSVQHARAMHNAGISFDGASNEAVATAAIALSPYISVFWILGEESTADETFSATEQSRLTTFFGLGQKRLFVSGSEIMWDLDQSGTAADKSFANTVLRTGYVGDSAATYNVAGSAGLFAGLGSFNFSPASGAPYDAGTADRLSALNGAIAVMTYSGGSGGNAATAYESADDKFVVLGFPFETITSSTTRDAIMVRVRDFFALTPTSFSSWSLY